MMEGEDFFEGLSNGKKGTTATINRLIESGHLDNDTLAHFKDDLFMAEKQILEAVRDIVKIN